MRSIMIIITIAIAFLLTCVSAEATPPDKGFSPTKIAQMSVPEIEEAVLVQSNDDNPVFEVSKLMAYSNAPSSSS